jgi:uncharacterized protein GlcG (DUF336 family)
MTHRILITAALAATFSTTALAQDSATFNYPVLIPEVALEAAQAAMHNCRDSGYQVAVAVVDRGGNTQVLLRDRFAGAHTPDTAVGKAWTAVSFRTVGYPVRRPPRARAQACCGAPSGHPR